jgi:hypothetical protein
MLETESLIVFQQAPLGETPATSLANSNVNNGDAFDATLTGASFFSGDIETLSNGSYRMVKGAEKSTVISWLSMDPIKISCEKDLCVVTDLRTKQSVHAQRKE